MKHKKAVSAAPQPIFAEALSQGGLFVPEFADTDIILDNFVKTISDFGFRQVVLPTVDERRIFREDPILEKLYGSNLLTVSGHFKDLAVSPTNFLSALKLYFSSVNARGPHVAKWFYVLPAAAGHDDKNYKLHHELGMFIFGECAPLATAQLINTVNQAIGQLGIPGAQVEITSRGCPSCQKDYQNSLREHLINSRTGLCNDCFENVKRDTDILSIMDCQNDSCHNLLASSPQFIDFLDESCRGELMGVLETIDDLEIPYSLSQNIANPLTREKVAFKFSVAQDKGEKALGHGGNYSAWADYLGNPVPSVGFMAFFENLAGLVPVEKRKILSKVEVFLVPLGAAAIRKAMVLYRDLRNAGIKSAECMLGNQGIKQQLKEAENYHPEIALIIGQKEAMDGTVILRDIRSGMQEIFSSDRTIEEVKKRLGK